MGFEPYVRVESASWIAMKKAVKEEAEEAERKHKAPRCRGRLTSAYGPRCLIRTYDESGYCRHHRRQGRE